MQAMALAQLLISRTLGLGLQRPVIVPDEEEPGSLTLFWMEYCVLCRIHGTSLWMAICGWGELRGLRCAYRGLEEVDKVAGLFGVRVQGAVTVSL
jgi:hypothetical protein